MIRRRSPTSGTESALDDLRAQSAEIHRRLKTELENARSETERLRAELLETKHSTHDELEAVKSSRHELREKLLETRQAMKDKLGTARAENQLLREKLVETRQTMADKLNDIRVENQELRRKLAFYERRHAMKDVDAIAHNSAGSMDRFFAEIPDEEPYTRFGAALGTELRARGVVLDGRAVADVGTGPGIALKELLRDSAPESVTGFDFSSRALENARRLIPTGRFEVREIYEPVGEQFDVVLCTEVLEHLERPADALRAMAGMISPGGVLVLTVPDGRIDFSAKHINFWSPESWRLFLEACLPDLHIEVGVFAPTPATGHQNNLALVRRNLR